MSLSEMAHATIQTTVDVYGHLLSGSKRDAVNRLDVVPGAVLKLAGAAGRRQ